ncbi:alpha-glucosidase-like protein [Mytilinidion resinicola]|uniref:alpha-glucosidase n=1 Tax=Mytilinidion resinicola TaxID=574789 RepID=A0A6A6YV44_9PEZI|nr:alpha-glucosidase-like protein [Mytilinidion resinicola]KAF2812253.1 alpha-glucosidase-like protein [Mytilinidion resinicola]
MFVSLLCLVASAATAAIASPLAHPRAVVARNSTSIDSCPGYNVYNIVKTNSSLTADLKLAGPACNVFGKDLDALTLLVEYQTIYQVQESVLPRPNNDAVEASGAALEFDLTEKPFSFQVKRKDSGKILFDTSGPGGTLIFESQYVRLRTQLPQNPSLYGLGEHSDSFQLETHRYTRTLWNAESPFIPDHANLYGSHPMYFDHRGGNGTHGVFLLNSNGMDINIDNPSSGTFLEYNTLGGVIDLYIVAGPGPVDVNKQYAEIVGLPAMQPYWTFGFHQCKYGYNDTLDVAEVIANYSTAKIPLEVMWTDINYMDKRQDFTTDPQRFKMGMMRELVDVLHSRNQRYILILDPGIHMVSGLDSYKRGVNQDVFLKTANNATYEAVAWPGVVAYPDWFAPNTEKWWTDELGRAFDPDTGVDIDGVWVDMNEASNFCPDVTCVPEVFASQNDIPPAPAQAPRNDTGRIIPGFPKDFQPQSKRDSGDSMKGLNGRNLLLPPYGIHNHQGDISNRAIWTNISNYDGTVQYDTHNFYGTMMAYTSRTAMLARRPSKRPFVLTRSTFAGAGRKVAHWFGDNASEWKHYRITIQQMLTFASLHQMPMVGSDVCGFNENTNEELCARWAMLGAFQPFYRNHADITAAKQEFYLWPIVTAAAKKAIDVRYKLADYIYTALYRQTQNGTPLVSPLFFAYPNDSNTFGIQTQWLYGPGLLVSPVMDENSTSVSIYLPDDIWYDYWTGKAIRGHGKSITLNNVELTDIPLHIKGGSIIVQRAFSAMTLDEVRKQDFNITVAPGLDGTARGSLYVDDGESLVQDPILDLEFYYDGQSLFADGILPATAMQIMNVQVLDPQSAGGAGDKRALSVDGPWELSEGFKWSL